MASLLQSSPLHLTSGGRHPVSSRGSGSATFLQLASSTVKRSLLSGFLACCMMLADSKTAVKALDRKMVEPPSEGDPVSRTL
jgi:hypothetical protein